ncbi:MAG TPA: 1,3-beta-galactosyl-N-acetylhexosamine phosphorylase, partial [Clostridiales bacterium]|nr:1,3-beta-galactosyl-N-acetylhexosamine phosphorylase [Clostridiales bacterium]
MKRGRLTIPTDKDFVEGTKKLAEYWGADAVRDCDGTELPDCARELAEKVYKTYFPIRDDNEYAYSHYDETGCVALITDRATAVSDRLEINLLDGLFKEQIAVYNADCKKYWQVFDRTAGKEIDTWEYIGNDTVRISGATPMHEYTVNFFGKCLWDPTQIYNYTCNGWTKTKDRDIDPVYPAAFDRSVERLKNWLKENEQVNVVRFTTLFYHFFLLYKTGKTQKLFDWYNYAMAASPAMFKLFKERYGYEITLEDVVNAGDYSNLYVIPSKAYSDYTDLVQKFVSEKAKVLVDEVHKAGREAIMFWGDNWIGAEPYGKYFKDIGFEGVVGSAVSGVNVRIVADIPDIKYREIRLNPYFFPDTLADDDTATERLKRSWTAERRAILGKPVDRIGFGGYLKIAAKFPKFCAAVKDLCDEFREICDAVGGGKA